MNETLNTLYSHVSIRKYLDKPISEDHLLQILKAACSGSTMGNMQLFSVIVTRDKEKMKAMAPAHFNQPIATNAPLILTFCADFNRFNQYCKARKVIDDSYNNLQSYHWAVIDALIAAQNACVAAESLGIGICWLGTITFNPLAFIDALELPKNVIPIACVSMGYPDEKPELTDKLPLEALIHFESYHQYSSQDIDKLYFDKEHHPNTIKLLKENGLDNLAQIFTQKRYVKKDNENAAAALIEAIRSQQFMK